MKALKEWRDGQVREGRLPLGALKDAYLKNALTRGRRDERLVASVLPDSFGYVAADLVAVIMDTDPISPQSTTAAPRTPAPPPRSTSPERTAPPSAPAASPSAPSAAAADAPPAATPGPETTGPSAATTGPVQATDDPMAPPPLAQAAPPPAPAPVRTPERMAELRASAQAFAQLDFTEELGEPTVLRTSMSAGVVNLSWDPAPDATVGSVFRVVFTDDQPAYAPDYAELVDITSKLVTTDPQEFTAAVRYYQVWRNSGSSWREAVARQPRLHAQAELVVPIQALSLREDGGRVIGQWSVFPGVTRVHVYRIPIERAAQAGQDPQFLISTGDPNLSGFIDREAVRGKRFLYRFYAEATVNGVARLSAAVGHTVAVSALLSPVEDLTVEGHGTSDDWLFDLSWTNPPAGRVVIYRTANAPVAGLGDEVQQESALPGGGLAAEDRLAHPTQAAGPGRTGMREVPSPVGWDRIYFTPVTVIEGRVMVGPSVSKVVIPTPEDLVIVERTQHQLLKFSWPGNAAAVAIARGPLNADAVTPQEGPDYAEISRDKYRRLGGHHLKPALRAGGCSVHVAGVAFVKGARIYGEPAVVQYPGLLRMSYTVDLKRTLLQRVDRAIIRLYAETDLVNCPPFVLVFNPERLPLHAGDGECLPVAPHNDETAQPRAQFRPQRLGPPPTEAAYRANIRGRTGYLRVFPDLPPEVMKQIALLDPSVSSLIVTG